MVADKLSWQEWRSGGAQLLLLRDLYPAVPEAIFAAGARLYLAAESEQGRADALLLMDGIGAATKSEEV